MIYLEKSKVLDIKFKQINLIVKNLFPHKLTPDMRLKVNKQTSYLQLRKKKTKQQIKEKRNWNCTKQNKLKE